MENQGHFQGHVWVEINREHFLHNVELAKQITNGKVKIMAIVKGNAYGHGINALIPIINESSIDRVGVYRTEEAIELVKKGINKTVHQLTYANLEEMSMMANHGVIITISTPKQIDDLLTIAKKRNTPIAVHLRVNVNDGEIGLSETEIPVAIQKMANVDTIKIEGVFTHLPSIYLNDKALIDRDIKRFAEMKELVKGLLRDDVIFHAASSPALYGHKEIFYDMIRIGTFLYGLSSFNDEKRRNERLKPVMAIKSRVLDIKEVTNEIVSGYSRPSAYIGLRKVAVVPIGYYDMPILFFCNDGEVLIEGKRCPIVGKPFMSHMIVDITSNDKARVGSEVVIVGKQKTEQITFEKVAERAGIDYVNCEIIGLINGFLPRKIVSNEIVFAHDTI